MNANAIARPAVKEWLEHYVKAIVAEPESVSVTQSEGQKTVVLGLSVAKSDIGRVKGRRGRMIRALESIVALAGRKERVRYVVDLDDSEPPAQK